MNSIRNYPTVVVAVAGGNGDGVSYLLDGSVWQDPYNSLSLPLPQRGHGRPGMLPFGVMRCQVDRLTGIR